MRVVPVDARHPQRELLIDAAQLLRSGRLVAFPTETVYGLGANALDAAAVQRIYDAKGRPAVNPIIVHVSTSAEAHRLALDWPSTADFLASEFWPGPLTLVVRKRDTVPSIVTAGRDTVGLRVPSHPIALALLAEARIPVAAPSANRSTQISPTTAEHVMRSLGDRVDMIIDGGPTLLGIESTVVDVTTPVPRILRPGSISREQIERVVGEVAVAHGVVDESAPASPGMAARHYAPKARVRLFDSADREQAIKDARAALHNEERVGAIVFGSLGLDDVMERVMPRDVNAYGREIYGALHALDQPSCNLLLIERPMPDPAWEAIIDRLERASR